MKSFFVLLILVLLLLPGLLSAQSLRYQYCPDNIATSGGSNVIPFGTGSSGTWENQRGQYIAKSNFMGGKPGIIRSLGFASSTTSGNIGFKALVIRLGHNTTGFLGGSFTGNFTGKVTTVINQTNFSWQITANAFSRIPINRPFIYNGKDHLIVDIFAYGNTVGTRSGFRTGAEPRAYKYNFTPLGKSVVYGKGCAGSNTKVPTIAAKSFPLIGADFYNIGLTNGPASSATLLFVGRSKTTFASIPLPFGLGYMGATGCALNTSILFSLPGSTDSTGSGVNALSFPYEPALHGISLYSQFALIDKGANPAGFTTTQGLEFTLDLYTTMSASTSSTAGLKMEIGFL